MTAVFVAVWRQNAGFRDVFTTFHPFPRLGGAIRLGKRSPEPLSLVNHDRPADAKPKGANAFRPTPALKIVSRQPGAADAGSSLCVRRRPTRGRARIVLAAVALAAGSLTAVPAFAAWSGDRGEALPSGKLVDDALTYSSFNGQCSQSAFLVVAEGHLAVVGGPVVGKGSTTLDGLPYDTYDLDLKTGPASFSTKFERVFTPALPSSSYEMVFTTRVLLNDVEQGVSITTIRCTNGVASGLNRAIPSAPVLIPVGGAPAWLLLTLLLASAAALRFRTRRG